jgi:hypothetical protein
VGFAVTVCLAPNGGKIGGQKVISENGGAEVTIGRTFRLDFALFDKV